MADIKSFWTKNGKILVNSNGVPYYDDHCCCNNDNMTLFADIIEIEQDFGTTNAEKAPMHNYDYNAGGMPDQYNSQHLVADMYVDNKTTSVSTIFIPQDEKSYYQKRFSTDEVLYFTIPLSADISKYKGKLNVYKEQSNLLEFGDNSKIFLSGNTNNNGTHNVNKDNTYITVDGVETFEPGDIISSVVFNNVNSDLEVTESIKVLPLATRNANYISLAGSGEDNYPFYHVSNKSNPNIIYEGKLTDRKDFFLRNIITGGFTSYYYSYSDPMELITEDMLDQTYLGSKIGQLFAIDQVQKRNVQFSTVNSGNTFPNTAAASFDPNQLFYYTTEGRYYYYDSEYENWVPYKDRYFNSLSSHNSTQLPHPGNEGLFYNTSDNTYYTWNQSLNRYQKLYSVFLTGASLSNSSPPGSPTTTQKKNIYKRDGYYHYWNYSNESWDYLYDNDTDYANDYFDKTFYITGSNTYYVFKNGVWSTWNRNSLGTLAQGSEFPTLLGREQLLYCTVNNQYYYFDTKTGAYQLYNDDAYFTLGTGATLPSQPTANQMFYNTTDGCYYGYKNGQFIKECNILLYEHPLRHYDEYYRYPAYRNEDNSYEYFFMNGFYGPDYNDNQKQFNNYTEVRPVEIEDFVISLPLKKMDKIKYIKLKWLKPYLRYTHVINCTDSSKFPASVDQNTLVYDQYNEAYYRYDFNTLTYNWFGEELYNNVVSGTSLPTGSLGRTTLFFNVSDNTVYYYDSSDKDWYPKYNLENGVERWNEYYTGYYFGKLSGAIDDYTILTGSEFPLSCSSNELFYNSEYDVVYYYDSDYSDPWQESYYVKFIKHYLYKNPPIIGCTSPSYDQLYLDSHVKISNINETKVQNVSVSYYYNQTWMNCTVNSGWLILSGSNFYKLHYNSTNHYWYFTDNYNTTRNLTNAGSDSTKPPPYFFNGSIYNIFWSYYADFPSQHYDQVILVKPQYFDYQYGKKIDDIQLRSNELNNYEYALVSKGIADKLSPLIKFQIKDFKPIKSVYGHRNDDLNLEFSDLYAFTKRSLDWETIPETYYYHLNPTGTGNQKYIYLYKNGDDIYMYRYSYYSNNKWDNSNITITTCTGNLVDYIRDNSMQFNAGNYFYVSGDQKLYVFTSDTKWKQVPPTAWSSGEVEPTDDDFLKMYRQGDYGINTTSKKVLKFTNGVWVDLEVNLIVSTSEPIIPVEGDYACVGTTNVYQYHQSADHTSGDWNTVSITRRSSAPTNPSNGTMYFNTGDKKVYKYYTWIPIEQYNVKYTTLMYGYGSELPSCSYGSNDKVYYMLTGSSITGKIYRKTSTGWTVYSNGLTGTSIPASDIAADIFFHNTEKRFYVKLNGWYVYTTYQYTNINDLSANPNIGDWWYDSSSQELYRLMISDSACQNCYTWKSYQSYSGKKEYFSYQSSSQGRTYVPTMNVVSIHPLNQRQVEQLEYYGEFDTKFRWDYEGLSADLANIKGLYCEIFTAFGVHNFNMGIVGDISQAGQGDSRTDMKGFHMLNNPVSHFQILEFGKQYVFGLQFNNLTTLTTHSSHPYYNYYIAPLVNANNRIKTDYYYNRVGQFGNFTIIRPISAVYTLDGSEQLNLAPAYISTYMVNTE